MSSAVVAGRIANTASQWGLYPASAHIAYSASKAAIVGPAVTPSANAATGTPPAQRQRRHDPDRRQRLIDVALAVIAEHGIAGTSYRRVAAAAEVPLGSMTCHFAGMDELLEAAFTRLAEHAADAFDQAMMQARTPREAVEAIVGLITGTGLKRWWRRTSCIRLRRAARKYEASPTHGWRAAARHSNAISSQTRP